MEGYPPGGWEVGNLRHDFALGKKTVVGGGIFLHLFQWDSRPPSRVYRPIFAHIRPADSCLTTELNCTSRPSQQHREEEEKAKTCKIGVKSCLLSAFYMRLVALWNVAMTAMKAPVTLMDLLASVTYKL